MNWVTSKARISATYFDEGHDARLPALAAELVNLKPDVIVTTGTPGTLAAKRATTRIPIVFASVRTRSPLALSAHIRGRVLMSPASPYWAPSWKVRVQLIKELVAGLSRIAIIRNPCNPGVVNFLFQTRAAATALNLAVKPVAEVIDADRLKDAFAAIADAQPQANGRDCRSVPARGKSRTRRWTGDEEAKPPTDGFQAALANLPVSIRASIKHGVAWIDLFIDS